eukprot:6997588-Prorocentrum_lima.AAC.1
MGRWSSPVVCQVRIRADPMCKDVWEPALRDNHIVQAVAVAGRGEPSSGSHRCSRGHKCRWGAKA